MNSKGRVKVGIIGSQFQADIHAESFRIMPDEAEVVAVASPTPGNAEQFARKHGIPRWFTDYRQMLSEPDLEMVTIAAEYPDQFDTVKDFLTKKHASMKNYILASENKDELYDAFEPASTWKGELPYTIIVNEKGEVVYRERGELSFLEMRRAIVPELNRIKPWGGLSPIKPATAQATSASASTLASQMTTSQPRRRTSEASGARINDTPRSPCRGISNRTTPCSRL